MRRQNTPESRLGRFLAAALFVGTVFDASFCPPLLGQSQSPSYPERWVYTSANLQVDKSADDLCALIERAAKAGYTGVLFSDYKLQVLDRVIDSYFKNAERVKATAARNGIEIIPAVFSIGYSNGHLAHDVNLAEGLPVVDQPYVVKDQPRTKASIKSGAGKRPAPPGNRMPVAVLDARQSDIPNGGLEHTQGDRVAGFGLKLLAAASFR